MNAPKISVCIPVYNAARYLRETLRSINTQDFADLEIVAVDNRSDDGSWDILQEQSRSDTRFHCFQNETNIGMTGNFNACLQKARGEYIHYLLADDMLLSPRSLSAPIDILDRDRTVSLVASPRKLINEHSRPLGSISWFPDGLRVEGTEIINLCLFSQKNLIGEPSAVTFRKSQALRGFNPQYRQLVDLEMWFYLLEQGNFAFIGEALAAFRRHDRQLTRSYTREQIHLDDFLLLGREYFNKPYCTLSPWFRSFFRYEKYYRLWKNGHRIPEQKTLVLQRISSELGTGRFWTLLPLYKLINPVWKLSVKARLHALPL